MKKILLVNGSPNERGCTFAALDEVARELAKNGVEGEILWLGKRPLADCVACGACSKTGKCAFDDLVNEVAARLDEFGGIVVGSPVYYGGPDGRLTSFLDRLFYSAGGRLADKLGASVVSCRRGGATAAFERLNQYFLMSNMHVVGSQYWNQVHGNSPEEVRRDAEGLQTMRVLAGNMTYLLKALEAAEANGVPKPKREPRVFTNFVRG